MHDTFVPEDRSDEKMKGRMADTWHDGCEDGRQDGRKEVGCREQEKEKEGKNDVTIYFLD